MVQVLQSMQKQPSFGEIVGSNLGSGLGQGVARASEMASQLSMESQKMKERQRLINHIENPSNSGNSHDISSSIPQIEEMLGFKLTPDQIKSVGMQLQGNNMQQDDGFERAKKYASIGEHDLSRVASDEAKSKIREKSAAAARHEAISTQTLKSTSERAESLPQKEFALQNMIDAIQEGNDGFWTFDNISELTGIEALRSPEGAGFKTAGKEFFLGSLKRAGARPNQWVEQQISDMLPKIGRSKEANLSVAEALKAEMDVERRQIELTNELADEMERNFGYVRRDLSDQVRKRMQPYAEEKQKELQKTLMGIKETYSPMNKEGYLMYDPLGNLRRVPKESVPAAKKDGYKLYK